MYDAIVVGARCAGAPTARLLALKGYKVLLVDKSHFPSDTFSTHYIHQPGIEALKRWDLLDRVIATNCPPIKQMILDFGSFSIQGTPPSETVTETYSPRRYILDKILVDAAEEAGVEVRENYKVTDIVTEGGRVVGIKGDTNGGSATRVERARIVIGADGRNSKIAKCVNAASYNVRPNYEGAYYAYWRDVPVDGFEIYWRKRRLVFAAPTNDGLTCIGVAWPINEFEEFRSNVEGKYIETLQLSPKLGDIVKPMNRESKFAGSGNFPNFFKKPYGPGWALVGDAGYSRDPTSAWGIADAFRDAELLTDAIDSVFSGETKEAKAFNNYEKTRNSAVLPIYRFFTKYIAPLQPMAPELTELILSLRGNQKEINRFLGAVAGTVPMADYYKISNIIHLMGISGITRVLINQILDILGANRKTLEESLFEYKEKELA
jgi:flavin-dependent dehydrogenase